MQELSLNILDITMNGITAGADTMRISIEEAYPAMTITIRDNGCGLERWTSSATRFSRAGPPAKSGWASRSSKCRPR